MWIFLPFGFFSIVADRENSEFLIVRSRARNDVVRLVSSLRLATAEGTTLDIPIVSTPRADYPFRVRLHRAEVVRVLAKFVQDQLTYHNFKDECADRAYERGGGDAEARWIDALHSVWATMRNAEDDRARVEH